MADPNDGGTDGTAEGNAPSIAADADANVPVPLPTPTPVLQAAPTPTVAVKSGDRGFGISIPPDTRNQGGISLKASEFAALCMHFGVVVSNGMGTKPVPLDDHLYIHVP